MDEKEYLGAGMGFLIHNILWPRGQRNVKNPMASLAFQGRLKAGYRKTLGRPALRPLTTPGLTADTKIPWASRPEVSVF